MLGLLDKARQLRNSLGLASDGRDEYAFDPDSGISLDEQKEIRAEIEKVATQNRIVVSPEAFLVKAAKRGSLFPIMVNVAAVLVVAAGLALFYFLFQRGETRIAREDTATITAEGKLLEAVKKESDARLQEKNQQINQIEGRLAEIERQRQDLQANLDARVRDRETQLRARMAAELEAERARLQKQGLSEQDIEKKLNSLSAQQNASFARQLDAFRAEAETERKRSEAALASLKAQFNADLEKANADRQQVLADSRQKEAELQAQLAQRTRELQSAEAQTQQQLAALTSQKQQEDLVAQQLIGLYSVAQSDIAAKDYSKALTSLQAISSYVNSPEVAILPAIAKRRPVDQFIVDSLTRLVQGEMDKGKADTGSLVEAASRITEIRAKVAAADESLGAGKVTEAETQYGEALAVLPEIARSYAYFTTKAKESEAARQDALRAGLVRAEAAFAAGRFPETLAAYRDALAYLPESSARLSTTLSNIGTASEALAAQKARAGQTGAAGPVLDQGDSLLQKGQYTDAIAQYLAVLQDFPLGQQAPQAVKGINDSIAGLSAQAAADLKGQTDQVSALNDQLSSLEKELSDRTVEITGIKQSLMGLVEMTGDPSATPTDEVMAAVSKRFGDLAAAQGESGELAARLKDAQEGGQALQKQVEALSAENERLKAAPPSIAAAVAPTGPTISPEDARRLSDLDSLVSGYNTYIAREDSVVANEGEEKGRMRTIGMRDQFLGSLDGVFHGILDRIHDYDKRFIQDSLAQGRQEGRQDALQQAMSIVVGLSRQTSADQRRSYIEAQLKNADVDTPMKSFLKNLHALTAQMR